MLDAFAGRLWRRRNADADSVQHRSPEVGIASEPAPKRLRVDWLEHHTAVSYTHLTLPTTPYV